MNWIGIKIKLQEPFNADEIEWRVGSTNADKTKGLALAYVTNRAIQNRLDDVFGINNWCNKFEEWKGVSQICAISVWDEDKNQWITKYDGADDSQTEAVKGGLSDAMKRAAYQWGIGRYLYKLPQTWVELEPCGKSYKIKRKPNLPDWALPKGKSIVKQPVENKNVIESFLSEAIAEDLSDGSKVKVADSTPEEVYKCKACEKVIPEKVYKYQNLNLCMQCQKELKGGK